MSWPRKFVRLAAAAGLIACLTGAAKPAVDPANPTCPLNPDWSANPAMKLTPVAMKNGKVLERTHSIAGLLREHGGVTVTYSTLIQPVWMTNVARLMKITADGMNHR